MKRTIAMLALAFAAACAPESADEGMTDDEMMEDVVAPADTGALDASMDGALDDSVDDGMDDDLRDDLNDGMSQDSIDGMGEGGMGDDGIGDDRG
jgi:hypothetical protein